MNKLDKMLIEEQSTHDELNRQLVRQIKMHLHAAASLMLEWGEFDASIDEGAMQMDKEFGPYWRYMEPFWESLQTLNEARNGTRTPRLNEQCEWCGDTQNLQVDHIFSRARGGHDNPYNLQTLCGVCNATKGDK